VVTQPGRRPACVPPRERPQSLPPGLEGARQLLVGTEHLPDRRLGQLGIDAAGPQLGAEPRRAEPPDTSARLDPPTGELGVIEIPTGLELRDDRRCDLGGRPPPPQAGQQVAPAPRLAGEQVEGDRAARLQIEDGVGAAPGQDRRKKLELPPSGRGPLEGVEVPVRPGTRSSGVFAASIVISPVDSTPFTFSSKSSGFDAASRAVS